MLRRARGFFRKLSVVEEAVAAFGPGRSTRCTTAPREASSGRSTRCPSPRAWGSELTRRASRSPGDGRRMLGARSRPAKAHKLRDPALGRAEPGREDEVVRGGRRGGFEGDRDREVSGEGRRMLAPAGTATRTSGSRRPTSSGSSWAQGTVSRAQACSRGRGTGRRERPSRRPEEGA